ncbi:MAG: hypothetical protein GF334_13150 [Candidatus Altiarchaeales archaeon]|nr:hypothetical protein [Candidatus Altiarchaeales archaeon]
MSELEELRARRAKQLMASQQDEYQRQLQKKQVDEQIKSIINQIMTAEARQRLTNLRIARPDYARQIEVLLIQLAQSNRLPSKLDDEAFKNILSKLSSRNKKKINIIK